MVEAIVSGDDMADSASAGVVAASGRVPKRRRRRLGVSGAVGLSICAIFAIAAIIGPVFLADRAATIQPGAALTAPSAKFWFGTDNVGRDVFARVVVSIRPTLIAALVAAVAAAIVATVVGVAAGYIGGRLDDLVSAVVDLLFSVPGLLICIVVATIVGRGLWPLSMAIAIMLIPALARMARSATIEIRERAFVAAARLSGRGPVWIVSRHIVPNIMTPMSVMVAISLSVGAASYAGLSYLGFGVPPPYADFGSMIAEGQQYMFGSPWLMLAPSAVLAVQLIGFILLGDWMRDRFDPVGRAALVWPGKGSPPTSEHAAKA